MFDGIKGYISDKYNDMYIKIYDQFNADSTGASYDVVSQFDDHFYDWSRIAQSVKVGDGWTQVR